MKHFRKEEIQALGRIKRLNLINSITGIKPANLIGTSSKAHGTNLAIVSSVVHLGSNPPLLGFVMRPGQKVRRHTYENIQENGVYTINHVHQEVIEQAHYTSAKFDESISEFEACTFTEEYLFGFAAPFVKESRIKLGLRLVEEIPIERNQTTLIIGELEHLQLDEIALSSDGQVNLESVSGVGISGLNCYYSLKKIDEFPYARPTELPNFRDRTDG